MTELLNKYSARVTQPRSQGASQAMLYGTGMTEEDMNKPQIGITSVWYEGNTCNMHLLELAEKVKRGRRSGRHGRHAFQHDRGERRDFHGYGRHVLFAPVA